MNYSEGIYTKTMAEHDDAKCEREYLAYCRKPWSVIEVSLLLGLGLLATVNGIVA